MVRRVKILFLLFVCTLNAQTITGRFVEIGTNTGIPKGETVLIYTPKKVDTLKTLEDGYINGKITDVQHVTQLTQLKIYPSAAKLFVDGLTEPTEATITDILGRQTKFNYNKSGIDFTKFASGFYGLTLQGKNTFVQTGLILIDGRINVSTKRTIKYAPQLVGSGTLAKTSSVVVDSIVVLESEIVTRTKFPGFTSNNNSGNIGTKEVGLKVTLSGIARGVHPDSTRAYILPNAMVNVWELLGNDDFVLDMMKRGKLVATGMTDKNGLYSVKVPYNYNPNKFYTKTLYYAVEVVAAKHNKKRIVIAENHAIRSNPLAYNHIYEGKKSEYKEQEILSEVIDETYFYWVVLNGEGEGDGLVRGPALAKWPVEADGYAHPKTWIQPNHVLTDMAKKFCIDDWDKEGDAGIKQSLVEDSSKADIIINFVNRKELEGANGQYWTYIDYSSNTITRTVIKIAEDSKNDIGTIFEKLIEGLFKEEYRQGTLNLHDISHPDYNFQYFYANYKSINTTTHPTKFDDDNVHKMYKFLSKGW